MVYPSYLDAVSMVTMESLSNNLPVVAYDIPAIRFNYKNVRAVMKVPTGSTCDMADKIVSLLKGYFTLDFNEIRFFLKKFSNWHNVIKSEADLIKSYFIK